MRSQKAIEEKIERLRFALEAHRTQISNLAQHDHELLCLLRAEEHMLLTEIQTLTWVLGAPRRVTEEVHYSRLDHLPVLDRVRVGVGR